MATKTEEQIREEIAESLEQKRLQYNGEKRCFVGKHFNKGKGTVIPPENRADHATDDWHGDGSRISEKAAKARARNVERTSAQRRAKRKAKKEKGLLSRIFGSG